MKVKQAEKRVLWRSEITLAPYNPRKISDKAKKALRANLKKVGLLGGIVWNENTGNLVSGHQKVRIIDELENYDTETKENDYEITVEVVSLSEKEEKEQNIFMNSTTVQGEFDNDLLADLLKEIDYKSAGLDESDLNVLIADVPIFDVSDYNQLVKSDFQDLESITDAEREAKKQAVKEAKQKTKNKMEESYEEGESYIVVSFTNYENKVFFMEMLGQPSDNKYIKGEELINKLQISCSESPNR